MTLLAPETEVIAGDRGVQPAPTWDIVMQLFDRAMTISASPRSAIALMTLTLDLLEDNGQQVY